MTGGAPISGAPVAGRSVPSNGTFQAGWLVATTTILVTGAPTEC